MASHQETYVQNSNPSHNDPLPRSPLPKAFIDQAYERARARLINLERAEPDPSAGGHDHAGDRPVGDRPVGDRPVGDRLAGDCSAEPLLDGAALLRVVREPVEWLLTLAHRLSACDPVDTAAVDRVRAAFQARLAGRPSGVRTTDLLVVFGLLVGALDPGIVLRAVSETIGDGLAAVLESEATLAFHITGTADASAALRPGRTRTRHSRSVRSSSCPLTR
jgi:hypothetical protein